MFNVFGMLKMFSVNHHHISNSQIVVTDQARKPNSLLTDLLRDVISSINIFINITDVISVEELVAIFAERTPLPADVLSEYEKILKQDILRVNFATRKGQIELIFPEV